MEVFKVYMIISLSILYACFVIKNLIVLIDNLNRKFGWLPIILFIAAILLPGIFEFLATMHYISKREEQKNTEVHIIKLDPNNLDEEFMKIKKMIEEDKNDND